MGSYKGRPLGTIGSLATLSFHDTKNIICGEGGALLVNDDHYADRAETLRERGTDRAQFFRGEVKRYTWREIGSSYLLSELLVLGTIGEYLGRVHVRVQPRPAYLIRSEVDGRSEATDTGES